MRRATERGDDFGRSSDASFRVGIIQDSKWVQGEGGIGVGLGFEGLGEGWRERDQISIRQGETLISYWAWHRWSHLRGTMELGTDRGNLKRPLWEGIISCGLGCVYIDPVLLLYVLV